MTTKPRAVAPSKNSPLGSGTLAVASDGYTKPEAEVKVAPGTSWRLESTMASPAIVAVFEKSAEANQVPGFGPAKVVQIACVTSKMSMFGVGVK
jgi:hypothetical protein